MKLDRYTLQQCDLVNEDKGEACDAELVKDHDGDWVKWEDVDELLDEIDKMQDEIAVLLRRARG